ncbi:hypothetical protein [Nocardioides lijunqiniae]|uniref:hypothetical protein n=1 Tax=Nocardioides lijunqiniae TaxID=2760832 RepID=UPI00187829BC|nr:hypothetical protein [Nocardioides lijunqiniae]
MQTLHERLAELAELSEQRPDPGTAAAAAARGRAYRRRRLVGTAATLTASAAALALIVGISLSRSAGDVEPAPAGAPTGMPRELYEPSPWLPGTADEPLGTLAAIIPAERATWTGREDGLVGVSATSGAYRFLDLPGAVPQSLDDAAISPDGRRVAYWTTGDTRLSADSSTGPVTGVAVYDSDTGAVVRHDIATDHGLQPEGLIWSDAATLLIGYGQQVTGDGGPMEEQGMSTSGPWLSWRVGQDGPAISALTPGADVEDATSGRILVSDHPRYVVTDGEQSSRRVFRIRKDLSVSPVVDASGLQVAVVSGESQEPGYTGSNPNKVLVGRLPVRGQGAARELVMRELPGSENTFDVVAWADDEHVVLLQAADESSWNSPDLVVVDVRTGEERVLLRSAERRTNFLSDHYATDLFSRAPIAAPEPPHPWDPRVSTGLAAAVLLAGAVTLIVWRRRAPA